MKQVFILGVVMAAMAIPVFANAQMVIVVRHAERADDGASPGTSMTASPDPELSEAGKARAQKLAAMLGDAGIAAIYTTEYRRTKDTGAPLAAKVGVAAEVVLARDAAALIAKITSHKTGAVLVVGHSNTVPAVVKALGGSAVTMADDEYDSMYFVAANGTTTRIRFKP
ncbi:MAG: histidine phosphatase family protein [Acidobacteria bacterium]|nr:histidine phosphatase family protein [Acidobacteriota bacterium]